MRLGMLLLVLIGLAQPALAQTAPSRLDDIIARGTLRVGLTGDYRPFSLLDKDTGKYTGLDVDVADAMAKSLGVKLEIVPTVWKDLLTDVTAGKFDIGMGGISVTLDRAKVAFFSTPVMRAGKTPIVRCTDKDKFATVADIDKPGVKVITLAGGTNERFDRANLHTAQIVIFPDNVHIFDEILAGRADVMITDVVETRLQQKLHPELCALHPDAPFDFGELAYLLPRDVPLKAYVDLFLHFQEDTGAHAKMEAAWLN
jgi:cyclohexadienyl dehydratase